MNKRCMAKVGAISLAAALTIALILIISTILVSATKEQYSLGEKVKIEIGNIGEYKLTVKTPSQTLVQKSDKEYFILKPTEIGEYKIKAKSQTEEKIIEFEVIQETSETIPETKDQPEENGYEIQEQKSEETQNTTKQESSNQTQITIGKPVSWTKEIAKGKNIKIKIPESSTNISINSVETEFKVKKSIVDKATNLISKEPQKSLIIQEAKEELAITYQTPSPNATEKTLEENRKEITISSDIHYENVLAFTNLPKEIPKESEYAINIYWKEEKKFLPFKALDTNNNSLLDKIEWTVPHLSTQTFEVIIITKAEHLSENKTFIEDIYEKLKEKDNITKTVSSNEYIRVTFETQLDNTKDITIYAQSNESANIEVYEKDSTVKIAEFENISKFQEYKIFLTNLENPQDTFDLKIVNAPIEFDHIIDPTPISYIASTEATSGSSEVTSITVNVPAGIQENDLLIAVLGISEDEDSGTQFTTPSGWTEVVEEVTQSTTSIPSVTVYRRVATSSEPASYTWQNTGTTTGMVGQMLAYRGAGNITGNPIGQIATTVGSSSGCPTSPSVTTTYANETVLYIGFTDDDELPSTESDFYPLSTTGRQATESSAPYLSGVTLGTSEELRVATGATGTRAFRNCDQNEQWGAITISILPDLTEPSDITVNQTQCQEAGTWKDCSELDFGETLTAVRVNCTTSGGYIQNVTFNLTNTPDNTNFFYANATSNSSDYWTYNNTDIIINDSGEFELNILCIDDESQTNSNTTTWEVEWGSLVSSLVSPTQNANVTQNEFFTFTSQVICLGGECGEVNATLDPVVELLYDDFEDQDYNDWTNSGWSIESDQAQGSYSSKCASTINCQKDSISVNSLYSQEIEVTFMYRDDDCDGGDVILYFNDSSGNWDNMGNIDAGTLGDGDDTWNTHTVSTSDSQYFHEGFAIRFWADPDSGMFAENYWVDNVNISMNESPKGIIPMNSGDPFYTTDQNPTNSSYTSCLSDMKSTDSCQTSWQVNATGRLDSTWEFFTIYESTNYPTYVSQNQTASINITISNSTSLGDIEISSIQCEEGGSWKNCNETDYGETITRVRANCTSLAGDIISANFTLTNIPDSIEYFNSNATSSQGDFFIYDNTDITINESGQYDLQVVCEDNASASSQETESWNVDWGTLSVSLLDPDENTNVNPNTFFDFTTRLTCTGGECGSTNVSIYHSSLFGDSSDGPLTVSTANTVVNNYTYLTSNELSGETSIVVNSATNFQEGDEILIIQMQNSSNGIAGNYEFKTISSIAGSTLNLNSQLTNSYYSGTFNTTTSTSTQVVRIPQYTTVRINSGGSITSTPWNGYSGGIVAFRASGLVRVIGSITVEGQGFRGGAGGIYSGDPYAYAGESYQGLGSNSARTANLGGGGGGESDQSGGGVSGASGAGGSYATQGQDGDDSPEGQLGGLAGSVYGTSDLSTLIFGSGGGGGGADNGVNSGIGVAGGSAAGAIYIMANEISVSGTINANGLSGESSGTQWAGSGGSGSGGSIKLSSSSLSLGNSIVTSSGGTQTCGATGRCGGAGGDGTIAIDYNSISGSTSPTASTDLLNGAENILLSTTSGDTPFYTTSTNPINATYFSCLSSMTQGSTCDVNWSINATGANGGMWTFFVAGDSLTYSQYETFYAESAKINITIGNLPPTVPELNFPVNASSFSTFQEFNWSNSTDPAGDSVSYYMQISNDSEFSNIVYSSGIIAEQPEPTGITPSGISTEGQYFWRVLATDLSANSSWSEVRTFFYDNSEPTISLIYPEDASTNTSSNDLTFTYNVSDTSLIQSCSLIINGTTTETDTTITKDTPLSFETNLANNIYSWSINCTDAVGMTGSSETRTLNVSVSNNAPKAREIECEDNSTVWKNCSEIGFGDIISRVRVRCTDPESGVTNATINMTNIPDNTNYIYGTTLDNSSDYWIYDNTDIIINDSGNFKIEATCMDNENLQNTNTTIFEIAWGNITINLLNPNIDSSVMQNVFFDFTTRLTCTGGECGSTNVSIYHSSLFGDSSDGPLTVSTANTVVNNYTYLTSNELSGETSIVVNSATNFQEGDEILIIQMQNSSNGIAGNYEFKTISSIAGSTLNLDSNLTNSYYSGTFNTASATSTQVVRIPQYTTVTINAGASITSTPWDGYSGGIVAFRASGAVVITGGITVEGQGFRGGSEGTYPGDAYAYAGESYQGLGSNSVRTANLGGGGGGESDQSGGGVSGASGAGGSYATQGQDGDDSPEGQLGGLAGTTYGNSELSILTFGSGGGGGGSDDGASGGAGGSAAGAIYIMANDISVSGTINSNGLAGESSGTQWAGSGGAGSGGSIRLSASSLTLGTSIVTSTGGSQTCGATGRCGGAGGNGIIMIDYNSISGSTTPIASNNSLDSNSDGTKNVLVSTTSGDIPFYTTSSNPTNETYFSCLSNMKSSNTCDVNWSINATGALNSVWNFFTYANTMDYQSYFNETTESSHINITIVSQLPPTVPQLNLPLNNTAYPTIPNLNWTNSTDVNWDTVYYGIEVSNTSDFSTLSYSNYTIPETTSPTGITPTGITSEGKYFWRVFATDQIDNSSWSETWIFYYDTSAPEIGFINQTGEDGRLINESSSLQQSEITTFFINITDSLIDQAWIVIWDSVIGGTEKIKEFFTLVVGSVWVASIQTDSLLHGVYNYTIYTNDSLGSESNYTSNFSVIDGNITLEITPSSVDMATNISATGHLNLTNTTSLSNYPINIWLNGTLLTYSQLSPTGTYFNDKSFSESSSSEFNWATRYNIDVNPENITLNSGTYGNITRILDAGALVEWSNVSWDFQGAGCSGTLTYQNGDANNYSGTEDTYITSGAATTNYGTEEDIIMDGSPSVMRGLIKFTNIIGTNLGQIPEDSNITNANISFEVSDVGNQISVYRLLENWTELEATYNQRLTGTSWSTTGAAGTPSRAVNPFTTFNPSPVGEYTIDITSVITGWTNGSYENYGIVLDLPTSNGVEIRSSEYTTQSERPMLRATYSATECTGVTVYVRTSNDKNTWSEWQQLSNGESVNDTNIASRYLEYKIELTSTNPSIAPTLEEINFNYTSAVTDASGNFNYSFQSPGTFGIYEVTVNTSLGTIDMSASQNLSVQSGVAPNVYLIDPEDQIWSSTGNFNLTYNATDLNDDFANATLIINGLANATNTSQIQNNQNNTFEINFPSGEYNWTVNVTDQTGYTANTTTRTFYIDLQDPTISLIYPENETTHNTNQLNLSFNVTDNMDTSLTCNISLDEVIINSSYESQSGQISNISTGIISTGQHYWNITCQDNAGRITQSEILSFNITDTPPTVTLLSPETNALDADGTIEFIYNVTDNTGLSNCSLIINETYRITNSSPIDNNENNSIEASNLPEGNHNWTIECYDISSSIHSPSSRNITVDKTAPQVNLNLPSNSQTFSVENISLNFTAIDTIDSILECSIMINSQVVASNILANSGELTSRQIGNLYDGANLWNVTCSDDIGRINTSETRTFIIEKYPNVTLNTPNESSYASSSINLTYTPSDNTNLSTCGLYLNGAFNQSNASIVLNNQQNNFTLTGISDGKYDWYVNCTDYLPLSNASEIRTFYIDNTPPQIESSYPDGQDIFQTNITFNLTITDTMDENLTCNITVGSAVLDENFQATNGTITTRVISGITDGLHYWNATCWDDAGNTNTSKTYNFTRYSNPQITLVSPENNYWLNTTNIYLYYFPEDDEGITNANLLINQAFNQSNSTTITNHNTNNFSLTNLQDGQYNWTVNITDTSGLTSQAPQRTFYVDTITPSLILNSPNGTTTITTNNVTFNFTISDNLDTEIECSLELDGEIEFSGNIANATDSITNSILSDGNHTWKVNCTDEASNTNTSQSINFTIIAPPHLTLDSPSDGNKTSLTSLNFSYTPIDPIGIKNCTIFLDGTPNQSSSSIAENTQNNFTIPGLQEGNHNWTVGCFDSDDNYYQAPNFTLTIDQTPPQINLNSPQNNTGLNANSNAIFNWTATDALDNLLVCDLIVDGNLEDSDYATSGFPRVEPVSGLTLGEHLWNVTCIDQAGNSNTSQTYLFNYTYPDFYINETLIEISNENPTENESITINATVYNLGGTSSSVQVRFYDGDPDTAGTQIGTTQEITIQATSSNTTSVQWNAPLGSTNVFVVLDYTGLITELNETNNKANKTFSVQSWHFFYGNINPGETNFTLTDSSDYEITNWNMANVTTANIYVADYDSSVDWSALQAIGRTTSGSASSNDIQEIDSSLSMTGFKDSHTTLYLNESSQINETTTYTVFKTPITSVPITTSINASAFKTGILWDTSDDTNTEYDTTEKEDIVYITSVQKSTLGTYELSDYELRVPSNLKNYDPTNAQTAVFYLEIM